jgi:photosystem II stability/assembly factor-like uncharacterized protein
MILGKILPVVKEGGVLLIAVPSTTTGPLYFSYDFGATWVTKNLVNNIGSLFGVSIQKTSIIIGRSTSSNARHEFSTNLWDNRAEINVTASGYPQQGVVSANGQVFMALNGSSPGYVSVSPDSGANWTKLSLLFANTWGVSMTEDGQTAYISSLSYGYLKKSTNYGVTWANTGTIISSGACYGVAMSANGQYIFVGAYNKGHYFAKSSDYGVNWSESMVDTTTTGTFYNRVFCSASGQYVLMTTNANQRVYVSNNYGANWTRVLSAYSNTHQLFSTAVSNSGKYMVVGCTAANGSFYYSDDYGANWTLKSISGVSSTIHSVGINEI